MRVTALLLASVLLACTPAFAQEWELLDFAEQLEAMHGFGFQRPPEMDR